jgi:hypothetical protein
MAGVASMAAAISATDRNLSFAIQFLHLISNALSVWFLYANGEAIRALKGTFPHVVSTPREVGWSYHHEFHRLIR